MKKHLIVLIAASVVISSCTSLSYTTSVEPEKRSNGYLCDIKEKVSAVANGQRYELYNLISETVTERGECKAENFTEKATMRYIIIEKETASKTTSAQFAFRRNNGEFGQLENWIDLKSKYKDLDKNELIAFGETLPYQFENNESLTPSQPFGLAFWSKFHRDKINNQSTFLRNTDRGFQRTITNSQGDRTEECSVDAIDWSDC